ncbi:putative inactive reductase [Fusarium oxysporum f. sp. matthiolae]|nr:putative inactive reductase [Fusarium oxysporum f. sp. matthiolae]
MAAAPITTFNDETETKSLAGSRLFKPIKIGNITPQHRIAMCPLTRYRASDDHVPQPSFQDYYGQRASTPGTLLISEGTFISPDHGGYANAPGIYNQEQIKAWRLVTDAVHAKGGYIFCQLWALGRTASPEVAEKEGIIFRSSGDIPVDSDHPKPRPLSIPEIHETAQSYAQAAKNAIEAGFDGVELHGANGYLIDQFIQDKCNNRTDIYGGSIENRSRFAIEVVQAVCDAVGSERTGIRFSPWSVFNDMRMENPIPQFKDVIEKLKPFKLAYLHLIESRIAGAQDVEGSDQLTFAIEAWDRPLLIAGRFTPESARTLVDEDYPSKDIVVSFGRYFLSTPDLPFRIKRGLELNKYNRETFYTPMASEGYTDYPFSDQFLDDIKKDGVVGKA